MLTFDESTRSAAPPEDVWKALYDPVRFSEWWHGMKTSEIEDGRFVFVQDDVPDLPLPQLIDVRSDEASVVVSCLANDLVFAWRLDPLDGGRATQISVHVEMPEEQAARFGPQQRAIRASLERLAELAAGSRFG